jgi:hypothetical protein
MKTMLIAGSLGVLTLLCLAPTSPSQAQMMGWDMCREGYVYEPSRNVCVHKSKKGKRPAARKKAAQ